MSQQGGRQEGSWKIFKINLSTLSMMAKVLEGCKENDETSKLRTWKLGNSNRYLSELRQGEIIEFIIR